MAILIRGGLVVGPEASRVADVLVRDGVIAEVDERLDAPAGARVIDAEGCWVGPGLVDLHTHLREPGREEAETVESGARAAACGGYSAVVAMPNTEPALDNVALVSYVLERGERSVVDVAVAGAITQGRRGELLAPMAEMAELGVRLFTDDGDGVQSALVMRRALEYARPLGVRLAEHCEDAALSAGGSMNEGALSGRLGLVGRPGAAEDLMVLRDLELVRLTGAALHFLHLSTRRSIELVAAARAEGLPVTCRGGAAPFHARRVGLRDLRPHLQGPPAPSRRRRRRRGAPRGPGRRCVDAVASDHAPHARS